MPDFLTKSLGIRIQLLMLPQQLFFLLGRLSQCVVFEAGKEHGTEAGGATPW